MTASDDPSAVATAATDRVRKLRPGIKMLLVSLLLAVLALGLFVYALGMAQGIENRPQVKQFPLAISLLGFGLSSLLFWLAFLQLARAKR